MNTKDTLVARLKIKASVSDQEPLFPELGDFVDEALNEHAPWLALNYEAIPLPEYELVLLLAWERVCLSRASLAAPQPSIHAGSSGFGADRDSPYRKNVDLAKALRQRYLDLKSVLVKGSSNSTDEKAAAGDILVGELFLEDSRTDARVPFTTAPFITPPILSVTSVDKATGTVVLMWTGMSVSVYRELFLFQSTTAGLKQLWNSDGNSGIPFVQGAAALVFRTTDSISRAVKFTGLPPGTYYFMAVCEDTNNNYVFSNEVTVDNNP